MGLKSHCNKGKKSDDNEVSAVSDIKGGEESADSTVLVERDIEKEERSGISTVSASPGIEKNDDLTWVKSYTTTIDPENRSTKAKDPKPKAVSLRVYLEYFLIGNTSWTVALIVALFLLCQLIYSGIGYWLLVWANESKMAMIPAGNYSGSPNMNVISVNNSFFFKGFAVLLAVLFLTSLARSLVLMLACMSSSLYLHRRMLTTVMQAPVRFFDTHPSGHVLNYFSKEIGLVDQMLPLKLLEFLTLFIGLSFYVIIISVCSPLMTIVSAIYLVALYGLYYLYKPVVSGMKKIEMEARSPVISHLSTAMNGLSTVRVYAVEDVFVSRFDALQDAHSSAWYSFIGIGGWAMLYVDLTCVIYIGVISSSFMFMQYMEDGTVGLAIFCALCLVTNGATVINAGIEIDGGMTSVVQLLVFCGLATEAPLETDQDAKLSKTWPSTGNITFDGVSLRYGENSPFVLHDINFSISTGEKIGIVGRTGAGKSSLVSCLFRLTEPEGRVFIDGVDISVIGLKKLRQSISIIPQDPTIFKGTFRQNLDPAGEHSDQVLWDTLEEVQLRAKVKSTSCGLDHEMAEEGGNLSVGERQLLCLARAMLSSCRILVMDEATANVDLRTDELIQSTLRGKFSSCTVLIVAHRLDTVMDCSRVMVMSRGRLQEFASPADLLRRSDSYFAALVRKTRSTKRRKNRVQFESYM